MVPSTAVVVLGMMVVIMERMEQLPEKSVQRASMVHSALNAPLALTKMLLAPMQVFALLALLSFSPIAQISYMYEGVLVSHLVHINVYLTSTGCQIALHLWRS